MLADYCYSAREISHPPFVKRIIKQILLATCVIGTPTCVNAFPFREDPQSFQNYMNNMRWNDGSNVVFQNLGVCNFYTSLRQGGTGPDYNYDHASCGSGFVTISNPMGRKICQLSSVRYSKDVRTGAIETNFQPGNCRYK